MSEVAGEAYVDNEHYDTDVSDEIYYSDDNGVEDLELDDEGFDGEGFENEEFEDQGFEEPESEDRELEGRELNSQKDINIDIPIDIDVQLGVLAIDTDNAMAMNEGDLLTLETSCPGEVSLMFRGREIGRGKLVDVDGHIAVQITHNWYRS